MSSFQFPSRPAVCEELERMERPGEISHAEERTEWCVGMVVVVPKGMQQQSEDLDRPNQAECHQMPAVVQVISQIAGARVF